MAATRLHQEVERVLYIARVRRNLNSRMKAINNPKKTLQRVVVKSRRTGKPMAVMISASTYEAQLSYISTQRRLLNQ